MATRTRPKTLSASRRKRRPELECLEEKQLLSITFGADSTGTYAYDSIAQSRREINSSIPLAMHEGADGTLFVSYNSGPYQGTLRYDYGPNRWTGLTGWTSTVMSASPDNTLVVTLNGHGTWQFDGHWTQLASHDALNLAASHDDYGYASFGGTRYGTWEYSPGGWDQIDGAPALTMDATPGDTLYASYSNDGTWSYTLDAGWNQITSDTANAIAAISDYEMIGSFADGTYDYIYEYGTEITSEVATQLGHSGSTVIGSWSSGTYTYDVYTKNWQYVGLPSYEVA
jgi:hypothetical protein